jgi:hypothetical protein
VSLVHSLFGLGGMGVYDLRYHGTEFSDSMFVIFYSLRLQTDHKGTMMRFPYSFDVSRRKL